MAPLGHHTKVNLKQTETLVNTCITKNKLTYVKKVRMGYETSRLQASGKWIEYE